MRKLFAGVAFLLMLAIAIQFFLAATGAYDDAPVDDSFQMHRALGYAIILIAGLVALVGALARVPGQLIAMAGAVAGLTILQAVIAGVAGALDDTGGGTSTTSAMVFGLHAINAVAIVFTASGLVSGARGLVSAETA
ncbi:DUF6220 domain-containing protein [Nocardioides speluncae]|uniref:DUF6220 domain-containing protein n=1 Tax=Nocardioides speluncae TaxID=2670337 RepID=UPI000D692C09|nr:DUF6220 domain-containing protein [Nocardioides speluncae]